MSAENLPDIESQLDALLEEAEQSGAFEESAEKKDRPPRGEGCDAAPAAADEPLAQSIDKMIEEGEAAASEPQPTPTAAERNPHPEGEVVGRDAEAATRSGAKAGATDDPLADVDSLDDALDEMVDDELGAASDTADADAESAEIAARAGSAAGEAGGVDEGEDDEAGEYEPPEDVRLPASGDPDLLDPAEMDADEIGFDDPDAEHPEARPATGSAEAVADELDDDQSQQQPARDAAPEPDAGDPHDDPTRYAPRHQPAASAEPDAAAMAGGEPNRAVASLLKVAAPLLLLLAYVNRPLQGCTTETRDLVGFVGVKTSCLSAGLIAYAIWGLTAATLLVATVLLTVLAWSFYLLFLRRGHRNSHAGHEGV